MLAHTLRHKQSRVKTQTWNISATTARPFCVCVCVQAEVSAVRDETAVHVSLLVFLTRVWWLSEEPCLSARFLLLEDLQPVSVSFSSS